VSGNNTGNIRYSKNSSPSLHLLLLLPPQADVASKAELSELRARLVLKVDKDQFDSQLSRRPTWTEVEGVMREKADIASLERIAIQKVNRWWWRWWWWEEEK